MKGRPTVMKKVTYNFSRTVFVSENEFEEGEAYDHWKSKTNHEIKNIEELSFNHGEFNPEDILDGEYTELTVTVEDAQGC